MSGVVVIKTGVANTASMLAAICRLGASPAVSSDPEAIARATHVVLPGVGSFGAGMAALQQHSLVEPLRARIRAGRATLCVCLGMQLLAKSSEETPGISGLGVIDADVTRYAMGVRVPHMGWNFVGPWEDRAGFWAYFANSYCLKSLPGGFETAASTHGESFVACLRAGNVLACQFHPELSGAAGLALIRSWLDRPLSTPDMNVKSSRVEIPHSTWLMGELPTAAGARERVRVIPCLDVRDGRVVKGVKFEGLRDAGDPVELAGMYESQGADELVMLDVSATTDARATAIETVRAIRRELSIPLTVGGGVRAEEDAAKLLDAGADKVSINTAAVRHPSLVRTIASRYGDQCTVIAIDAARHAGSWRVVVRSGSEPTPIDAIEWARACAGNGAGEVLLTSMDRDGTHGGYDLELIDAVSRAVHVPVIASGGAGTPEHLAEAVRAGASAVLAASIFHNGTWTVGAAKESLRRDGIALRMETNA